MKDSIPALNRVVRPVAASLFLLFCSTSAATTVYDNYTNPILDGGNSVVFSESGYEFGEEIVLSSNAFLTNFTFQIYGTGWSGNEAIRFRIYRNDGAAAATNALRPDTLLYQDDFYTLGLVGTVNQDLSYILTNNSVRGVPVPGNFTWTVEFSGVETGETAALVLYSPPTVGGNFDDYYERSGAGNSWVLRSPVGPTPISFAARAEGTIVTSNTLPKVTILSPVANFNTNGSALRISGDASRAGTVAAPVAMVLYKVNSGSYMPAVLDAPSGSKTNWHADISLVPGANTVTAKSVDQAGVESKVAVRVFYQDVPTSFGLFTNGTGSVISTSTASAGTPTNGATLLVNRLYTVTAVPGSNFLFTNWTASINAGPSFVASSSAQYTFSMQTNLTLTANFVTNRFNAAAGNYIGLFRESTGVFKHSAGSFTLKVTPAQAFSGKIYIDGQSASFSGTMNIAGDGTLKKAIKRKGRSDLIFQLHLDLNAETVTGTVSNSAPGGFVSDIVLSYKASYDFIINPATNYAGLYTMVLPGSSNDAIAPGGDSYLTITVLSNGVAKASGMLASGGAPKGLTFKPLIFKPLSVQIGKNGEWAFFQQSQPGTFVGNDLGTYKETKAILWGSLTYAPEPTRGLSGDIHWVNPGWTNAFYSTGFTNTNSVVASAYVAPTLNQFVLPGFPSNQYGYIYCANGDLSSPFTNSYFWTNDNKLKNYPNVKVPNVNTQKAMVVTKNGFIKGQFNHPLNGGATVPMNGVILQDQAMGRGFFLGSSRSGPMLLAPGLTP